MSAPAPAATQRWALGVRYRGTRYQGWQSQPGGRTVQDQLEQALTAFVAGQDQPLRVTCAGRTDAGVHAMQQVVHMDAAIQRDAQSWVRGTNRYLPEDIAVQWAAPVPHDFHARNSARRRRYRYVCLESAVRPSIERGLCGWVFKPLDALAMQAAIPALIGEHDFTSFRAAQCQALSPIKQLHSIKLWREGRYWHFDFEANAFLHHMVRNIMGCLVAVGEGRFPPSWLQAVLQARSRDAAAPTFAPDGLYFQGPIYDAQLGLPEPSMQGMWGA